MKKEASDYTVAGNVKDGGDTSENDQLPPMGRKSHLRGKRGTKRTHKKRSRKKGYK